MAAGQCGSNIRMTIPRRARTKHSGRISRRGSSSGCSAWRGGTGCSPASTWAGQTSPSWSDRRRSTFGRYFSLFLLINYHFLLHIDDILPQMLKQLDVQLFVALITG